LRYFAITFAITFATFAFELMKAKDKLIVALDVDSADRALDLFEMLRENVGMFKIGSQLFTAAGPDIVRQIVAKGERVFLDLKFHDIPNTVAAAAIEATRLGVSIFNVHASGGAEMMKRTAEAVAETSAREGLTKPKAIAVTLLTSLDQESLDQIGISGDPHSVVTRLARAAADSGLDGVVASPEETEWLRRHVTQPNFLIVTPGIRKASVASDDQRRVMTVAGAICAGADYLVVGRPILSAGDPADAARKIVAEIDEALRERLQPS
jgi:orotidine-5'-phosphate decarboxylase